jgi:hypothetical protein
VPPTFLYLFALAIWLFLAAVVWLMAGLMMVTARTRMFSRPLCFAMAGTFPFVFVYQLIAAPIVAALLAAAIGFWKILEHGGSANTENPLVIGTSIIAAITSFGVILVMSLAGFYEGWRVGWAFANGRRVRDVFNEGPTVKLLSHLRRKVRSSASLKPAYKRDRDSLGTRTEEENNGTDQRLS